MSGILPVLLEVLQIYDMLKYSPFLRHGEREVESERGRGSEANIPNFREGVRMY